MQIISDSIVELTEGECRVLALDRLEWHGMSAYRDVSAFTLQLRCADLFGTGHRHLTTETHARVMHLIRGATRVYVLPRD